MGWRCREPSRKSLRSPGRKANSESLCTPGNQPEKERDGEGERERERERERHRDQSSEGAKVFYSTLCEYLYCLTRQLFSAEIKSKLTSYQGNMRSSIWKRVVNNHVYHIVHKKEEGTYRHIEKLTKKMPGFLSPRARLASPLIQ